MEDLLLAPARPAGARGGAAGVVGGGGGHRARQGRRPARGRALPGRGAGPGARGPAQRAAAPVRRPPARAATPPWWTSWSAAIDCGALDAHLHDLLTRAGAPTSLDGLNVDPAAHPASWWTPARDLPAGMILDAQHGLRPTRARIELGRAAAGAAERAAPASARGGWCWRCTAAGPRPAASCAATRRSPATTPTRRSSACAPSAATAGTACATASRARAATPRWWRRWIAWTPPWRPWPRFIPRDRTVLAGFSQGACLALEYAARRGAGLAAVIAPCGARIGAAGRVGAGQRVRRRCRCCWGRARATPGSTASAIEATAAWFRQAGAAVEVLGNPGERHDISPRQRLRARELIRGAPGRDRRHAASATRCRPRRSPGALPRRQNSPRRPPFGLYAEQINGAAFTARARRQPAHLVLPDPPVVAAAGLHARWPTRSFGAGFAGRAAGGQPDRLGAAARRPTSPGTSWTAW